MKLTSRPAAALRRAAGVAVALTLGTGLVAGLGVALAAPAAAATSGPQAGVQFHGMWSDYNDAQRATVLDRMAEAGLTEVRIDLAWATLQPTARGQYDPWGVSFADRVITMATSRGLTPLVTLWLTPGWANNGAGEKVLPTDPADYAAVARWAADRWAGKVGAWEVWNEPNSTTFMAGADAVAYTRLLKAAYPAFKAGDPSTKVVLGAPEYNDTGWIGKVYAAGGAGSFDVMATHPYQGVADAAPETAADGTIWTLRHVAEVRKLMTAHGDGNKPVWFTEFGWSSHPNWAGVQNWDRGVTEAQQADYFVRTLRLLATDYPYVTKVFWYNDRNRDSGSPRNDNYGMLYRDLTPKPVWYAVQKHFAATAPVPTAPTAPAPTAPVLAPAVVTAPPTAPTTAPTTEPTTATRPRKSVIKTKLLGSTRYTAAVTAARLASTSTAARTAARTAAPLTSTTTASPATASPATVTSTPLVAGAPVLTRATRLIGPVYVPVSLPVYGPFAPTGPAKMRLLART